MIELHLWEGKYGHAALSVSGNYISFHSTDYDESQVIRAVIGVEPKIVSSLEEDIRIIGRHPDNKQLLIEGLNEDFCIRFWDTIKNNSYRINTNNCSNVAGLVLIAGWLGNSIIYQHDFYRMCNEILFFMFEFEDKILRMPGISRKRVYRYDKETISEPSKPLELGIKAVLDSLIGLLKNSIDQQVNAQLHLAAAQVGWNGVWNPKMVHGLGIHFAHELKERPIPFSNDEYSYTLYFSEHLVSLLESDLRFLNSVIASSEFARLATFPSHKDEWEMNGLDKIYQLMRNGELDNAEACLKMDLVRHVYGLRGNGYRASLYLTWGRISKQRRDLELARTCFEIAKEYALVTQTKVTYSDGSQELIRDDIISMINEELLFL